MVQADPHITAALVELEASTTPELRTQWHRLYGHEAPKRLSRRLLRLGVGYRMQVEAYGKLSAQTKALLNRYAQELRKTGTISIEQPAPTLKPGIRLMRDWHGQTHVVTVLDQGFLYRDARFKSLSEIARMITGVRRSGPAFFGLRGQRKRAANGVRIESV